MILTIRRKSFVGLALAASVYVLVSGCSTTIIDNDSPPEAQYADGERLMSKDRYIEAVERFRILKSRYPYSKYAALATLRIGDTHFQEEAFIEAAAAYKIFRELYPKHEKAAYALYRIGESNYNLLPSTVDRDLEPADSAIEAYQQLNREYPNNEYRNDANKRLEELKNRLALRELYVANFYYIREQYLSAANRYAYVIENYPEAEKKDESLFRLAHSYERIGEYRKSLAALSELQSEFPDSSLKEKSATLEKQVTAAATKE